MNKPKFAIRRWYAGFRNGWYASMDLSLLLKNTDIIDCDLFSALAIFEDQSFAWLHPF